jgi:hypothetical protein
MPLTARVPKAQGHSMVQGDTGAKPSRQVFPVPNLKLSLLSCALQALCSYKAGQECPVLLGASPSLPLRKFFLMLKGGL